MPRVLPELVGDAGSERPQRAMSAVLQMKKLDIAALRRAYDGQGEGWATIRGGRVASEQPTIEAYHELCAYTLSHGDLSFLHQHVVDAFAAQRADAETKPIGVTMALVGLYLHVEKGFSGRQVQRAHMQLARRKQPWPQFVLPAERGSMTAVDVMAAPPGPERDRAIHAWAKSVWEAFAENRQTVADLLWRHGIE